MKTLLNETGYIHSLWTYRRFSLGIPGRLGACFLKKGDQIVV